MGLLKRVKTRMDEKGKNPTLNLKLCVIIDEEIFWNILCRKGERKCREEEKKTILGTFQWCHEVNYVAFK